VLTGVGYVGGRIKSEQAEQALLAVASTTCMHWLLTNSFNWRIPYCV